jgi:hypothetical protein
MPCQHVQPSHVAMPKNASGFSSPGCRTGPHQSSIGSRHGPLFWRTPLACIKPQKTIGTRPSSRRVRNMIGSPGLAVPGSFRLMVWAYQQSLRRNGRRRVPINSLDSGQHFHRAHGPHCRNLSAAKHMDKQSAQDAAWSPCQTPPLPHSPSSKNRRRDRETSPVGRRAAVLSVMPETTA